LCLPALCGAAAHREVHPALVRGHTVGVDHVHAVLPGAAARGYAHAHLLSTRLGPRGQTVAQVTVLLASLALLMVLGRVWDAPIIPGAGGQPGSAGDLVASIGVLLAARVRLPFCWRPVSRAPA